MPPKETKEDIPDGMDALTPERAEEVASVIAEQWRRDWGAILDLVVAKTGISRSDAFQFMVLRELAQVRYGVEKGIQPKYHPDCAACREEKQFHEDQHRALKLTIQHLQDELGEEWKDGE